MTIEQVERQKLTEEEIEERDELLAQGFGDWKRRDLLVCMLTPYASHFAHTVAVRVHVFGETLQLIHGIRDVRCYNGRTSWRVVRSTAGATFQQSQQTSKASLWQKSGVIRLRSGASKASRPGGAQRLVRLCRLSGCMLGG